VTVALVNVIGAKVKEEPIYSSVTGPVSFGFVVPDETPHRLAVSSTARGASYTLRVEIRTPEEQVGEFTAPVLTELTSPMLTDVAAAHAAGNKSAVDAFWTHVQQRGAPLVEAIPGSSGEMLVTFVWKQAYETRNVLVLWPGRARPDHYLTKLPGTNIWFKTVRVVAGSRFSYRLAPNDGGRPPHLSRQVDPLNPQSAVSRTQSILETGGAPDESSFRRVPSRRGTVSSHQFEFKLLKGKRDIAIYTPPDYSQSDGPYALLILFDGPAYSRQPPERNTDLDDLARIGAPTTLDNLINARRIRPTVAAFVGYGPDSTRQRDLPSADYAAAVATELVPWLRSTYGASADPKNVVIGGYSAGGGAAGFAALKFPSVYGNVLLQSGGGPRLVPMILEGPPAPVRFYLATGVYEFAGAQVQVIRPGELPVSETVIPDIAIARRLRDLLQAKGYDITYRETGGAHEDIQWRATLSDGLVTLLGTPK
jgi:enterochelin esterase-like enzyme